ncbi:hypothetical protein H5J25_13615 [Sphingomonas aliaeris]|uniref:Uncharacterized protein n=1 Tax=Sphingomonas aliaeris TaxID=2759526 RepID=A0A974NT64_9SPHN|nr:hypothetical protein [Sphingomonas aliaeris]QQV76488.1 hypothetical protein H5J25_13615 [Sphingomonas aliaeris]
MVRITLELTFDGVASLWGHAARRAAVDHGLLDNEIIETFGPREDPDLRACAEMVFDRLTREDGMFETSAISVNQPDAVMVEPGQPAAASVTLWSGSKNKHVSLREYFRVA